MTHDKTLIILTAKHLKENALSDVQFPDHVGQEISK